MTGNHQTDNAPLHWYQRVAVVMIVLCTAAIPNARAEEAVRRLQALKDQRDLKREAELREAVSEATSTGDNWTLSGAVPLWVTSNAYCTPSAPQNDSYLGPWLQLNWQHPLRPRLVADISLSYTEYRYQHFADLDYSYADLGAELTWTLADTPTRSSSLYSHLSLYYDLDADHHFDDIEASLSGGANLEWTLVSGASVYFNPEIMILQAMPHRFRDRSYVSAGLTVGGNIPLNDQWEIDSYSSLWVSRYAEGAEETDLTQYLSATLRRNLTPRISLDLTGFYTLNASTIANAQYNDITVGLALNMSFTRPLGPRADSESAPLRWKSMESEPASN
ncbi:hypothetical protein [uncultured Lamprocystis sp.]|uniref:hypothetical protein n=1 Tax=uncultured Lamprocystis sp. TaxID=543132 RepID=UPI0025F8B683|nr:hypothetical protein [uncultured Lamprocystis sp.]